MEKTHDLILTMLGNPTFTLSNLKTVGLTADNTEFLSEDRYLSSPKIQNLDVFKNDRGEFDKNKFHQFYQLAQAGYNVMESDKYDQLQPQRSFHRANIWADKKERRTGPDFEWVTEGANPNKETQSLVRLGKKQEGRLSIDELAQREKVLANPIEATKADGTIDESKAIWHAAPEESFFTDFFSTRVLAQWDEDGTHTDPVSGKTVAHSKGDFKLNSTGNYYYENLEGRDVYGRRVLNKLNTLTKEDSALNKYDFFDSDDKDAKSFGGTVLKEAALVGSMFIPYIGPWVTGLSVFNQSVGLLGTLGKMATGFTNEVFDTNINNSLFSNMEGWGKSTTRQYTTQHALEHPWSLENMVGLIGDVLGQFKEQRFLFTDAPYIFKNKYGIVTPKNYGTKVAELEKQYNALNNTKFEEMLKKGSINAQDFRKMLELNTINHFKAASELDSYVKGYNKVGEVLSKGFMTGITVADSYGEALNLGATKQEAMWLTLGYGAGEAIILNTGIGEWLFPELRYEKLHQQAMLKAVGLAQNETRKLEEKLAEKSLKQFAGETKRDYAKRLFNIGKLTATDLYTGNKFLGDKTIKAAFFNALGEGIEEDTEELLADLSKTCFNAVEWLRGKDTRLDAFDNGDWSKVFDRYALNAVGGFIGGGIAGFNLDNIRQMKSLNNMEFDQGMLEIIYYVRNGKTDELLSNLNKIELGKKNLSATKYTQNEDGTILWAQGTPDDNLDLAAKNAVRTQIKLINDILDSNGIKMSDDSFLSKQTDVLKDIKYTYLALSTTAARFLQEFNSLSAKIVLLNAQLEASKAGTPDSLNKSNETVAEETLTAKRKVELLELIKQRDELIQGKRAGEYIGDALFELTDAINQGISTPSFLRYAESIEHKPFNQITDARRTAIYEDWKKLSSSHRAEQVHASAEAFRNVMSIFSPNLLKIALDYSTLTSSDVVKNIQQMELMHFLQLNALMQNPSLSPEAWITAATNQVDSGGVQLINAFNDETFKLALIDNENKVLRSNQNYNAARAQINDDTTLAEDVKKKLLLDLDDTHKAEIDTILDEKTNLIRNKLINDVNQLVDPYIKQGFANSEIKRELSKVLDSTVYELTQQIKPIRDRLHDLQTLANGAPKKEANLSDADKAEIDRLNNVLKPLKDRLDELRAKIAEIRNLSATPIENILDQFAISNNSDIKFSELLQLVNDSLDSVDSLNQFGFSKDISDQLTESLNLIDLFNSVIEASKIDEGDLNNVFGYNKTLNEVNHAVGAENYVDLPEISSEIGNVLQQDLHILRNKIEFLRQLYAANQGQKLVEHDKTSLNKDFLFYKKLKDFVVNIPDDWAGKDELQKTLENLTTLKDNYLSRNLNLDSTTKEKIDEESILMEDSVYDFFQKNLDNLKKADKVAELLSGFNLFEVPHGLLNSTTDFGPKASSDAEYNPNYLDDNAFIWWMCTRAAVKSTDFHAELALVIDNNLAPVPAQELAIYENYASVVNGQLYTQFFNGYRKAIQDAWFNMPEESKLNGDGTVITKGRKQIIKEQNEFFDDSFKFATDDMAADTYKEYPFVNLIVPKYANIVFTEGIPGAGKTTGVYKTTIKLLQKFHSDSNILLRVIVVHGANKESALNLVFDKEDHSKTGSLGLDPEHTTAMSLEEFMDYISVDRIGITENPDGSITVPSSKYHIDHNNEIKSTTSIKHFSEPPTLVIFDEITHANQFDLDDINKCAERYGFSVLAAGDTDLSGTFGEFEIKSTNTAFDNTLLPLGVYNVNFIRTPKLGVSMRTSNSQKTKNLAAAQIWVNNSTQPLELHYYQDEHGLFGDKVTTENDDIEDIKADIDLMLSTLNEGEKIGFIYDDENNELTKLLLENYSDKIEPLPGTSAQGKEGQYYIIQMTNNGGNFNKDIYTAITRSSQGSLIYTNEDSGLLTKVDSETHQEGLHPDSIKNYSIKRKETLSRITKDKSNAVTYVPRKTVKKTPPSSPTSTTGGLDNAVVVPPPAPKSPDPAPPTTDTTNNLTVGSVIQQATAKGVGIGSTINFNNHIRKITDIRLANDSDPTSILVEFEEDGNVGYMDVNELLNSEPYNVTDVESITNSSNIEIHKGDFILTDEGISQVSSILSNGIIKTDTGEYNADDILFSHLDKTEVQQYYDNLQKTEDADKDIENLGSDIKDETTYKAQINGSNQSLGHIDETKTLRKKGINIFAYTFNSFESGVAKDAEGNVVQFGTDSQKANRLDSINGLLNLDKQLGKDVRKYDEYMQILAELRAYCLNIADKSILTQRLQSVLNNYFGISGISITFGLVSHAAAANGSAYSTSSGGFERLQRNRNEELNYINSTAERAFEPERKTISCEIAMNNTDILELPLLSLANPITIMQQGLVPSEIMEIAQSLDNAGLENILRHESELSDYEGFVTLVKTYRRITGDSYFGIKDPNWTICNNLKNRGVSIIANDRCLNYVEPGYEYDADFIDIRQLAQNPMFKISDLLYSQSSFIADKALENPLNIGGTEDIIKVGNPFVFVTTDPTLNNTQQMTEAFIEDLQNIGECSRVKLVYVLPPKCSIDTYIKSLAKLMVGKKAEIDDVGNSTTAFKLLRTVFSSPEFSQLSINKSNKWVPFIQSLINDTANMEPLELLQYLNGVATIDGNNNISKSTLCKRFLASLVYPNINSGNSNIDKLEKRGVKNLQLIELALTNSGVDGVYFRAKKDSSKIFYGNDAFAAYKLTQNEDWTITDINGIRHSYQIFGHIDSNVFEGDFTDVLKSFLDKATPNKFNSETLENIDDNKKYTRRRSVAGLPNPHAEMQAIVNTVKAKTGLNIELTTLHGTKDEKLRNIVEMINSQTENCALVINHQLKIFDKVSEAKEFMGINSTESINSLMLNKNGEAHFRIKMGDNIYECRYSNDTIEIFVPQETKVSSQTLSNPTQVLSTINNSNVPRFLNRLKVQTEEDLINLVKSLTVDENLLKKGLMLVFNDESVVQEIMNLRESKASENNCEAKSIILNLL